MPEALTIRMLHHIAVPTRDPERSAAFYEQVVGMKRIPRPDFSFRGAWLFHKACGIQLHIIEHPSAHGDRRDIDTLAQHFALAVDDMDATEQKLKSHQIAYRRQVNAGGIPQIFFQDPDGNTIEVGIYPDDMENRQGA